MRRKVVKLSERHIHNIIKESVMRALNEMASDESKVPYEEWTNFLNGKMPVFEFHDDETDEWRVVYVDYDEEDGVLETGGVSNSGFSPDDDEYVTVVNGDFQSALEELFSNLVEKMTGRGNINETNAKYNIKQNGEKEYLPDVKGTLSNMAKEMLANNAQLLQPYKRDVSALKDFIQSEVEKRVGSGKVNDKSVKNFLYGSEHFKGIMDMRTYNQIIFKLSNVFQGGYGNGLYSNGMTGNRY